MNPLEAILRQCAEAAPAPWYAWVYARGGGIDPQTLGEGLEELWLEGLIDKVPGTAQTGPGIVLTDRGRSVLRDPQALEQVRRGLALSQTGRGAVIRQDLRRPARPLVTRLLLLANFLWFGYEVYLAHSVNKVQGLLTAPFRPDPAVPLLIQASGGLSRAYLVQGQWWRLLSSGFVHIGLIHLLLNMYMLSRLGAAVETMWGHWRYLAIYLLGLLGGGCLAAAYTPTQAVYAGASGALFGVFAADAVWILLNGRYLPRALARRARGTLLFNVPILVGISLVPGVSGAGHLGGALGGGAAALLLHLHRFSPAPWRWLALAGLVPLPFLGVGVLRWQQTTKWAEQEAFAQRFLSPQSATCIPRVMGDIQVYQERVDDLLEMHPDRRDPDEVTEAIQALDEQSRKLAVLGQALAGVGPYDSPTVEQTRQTALSYAEARARLLDLARRCLQEGDRWTAREEEALRAQEDKVQEQRKAWETLPEE
jgi:membrane associated rhomboid family serine protease